MLKILFLDEEGFLYTYDEGSVNPGGWATFDKVDSTGKKISDYNLFPFYEIREALNAIADLVEACNDND